MKLGKSTPEKLLNEKKIALVTGGNRGIGLEICRQLAKKGILVILASRNQCILHFAEYFTQNHGSKYLRSISLVPAFYSFNEK